MIGLLIVTNSLLWLAKEDKAYTHGFVIMPNHIHILWTNNKTVEINVVENTLLKFTGHQFKKYLVDNQSNIIHNYLSTQNDRAYHFWERRSRSIEIKSKDIAIQKLNYIHNNPLQEKWKLVSLPEDYNFSSAKYYAGLNNSFGFISHFNEFI